MENFCTLVNAASGLKRIASPGLSFKVLSTFMAFPVALTAKSFAAILIRAAIGATVTFFMLSIKRASEVSSAKFIRDIERALLKITRSFHPLLASTTYYGFWLAVHRSIFVVNFSFEDPLAIWMEAGRKLSADGFSQFFGGCMIR